MGIGYSAPPRPLGEQIAALERIEVAGVEVEQSGTGTFRRIGRSSFGGLEAALIVNDNGSIGASSPVDVEVWMVSGGSAIVRALRTAAGQFRTGLNGNVPVAKAAAIAAPAAAPAAYDQAQAQSAVNAVNAIRAALTNIGITA